MRGRKARAAAAAIHPLGLGATPVLYVPLLAWAKQRARESTTHHLTTTLPADEQTLHHHHHLPPLLRRRHPPRRATASSLISHHSSPLLTTSCHQPPASSPCSRRLQRAPRRGSAHLQGHRPLCTRLARYSTQSILPVPSRQSGLTPIGTSQYRVFFCKQATALPEALTRHCAG